MEDITCATANVVTLRELLRAGDSAGETGVL